LRHPVFKQHTLKASLLLTPSTIADGASLVVTASA
jgi:hypothetical protein